MAEFYKYRPSTQGFATCKEKLWYHSLMQMKSFLVANQGEKHDSCAKVEFSFTLLWKFHAKLFKIVKVVMNFGIWQRALTENRRWKKGDMANFVYLWGISKNFRL